MNVKITRLIWDVIRVKLWSELFSLSIGENIHFRKEISRGTGIGRDMEHSDPEQRDP